MSSQNNEISDPTLNTESTYLRIAKKTEGVPNGVNKIV